MHFKQRWGNQPLESADVLFAKTEYRTETLKIDHWVKCRNILLFFPFSSVQVLGAFQAISVVKVYLLCMCWEILHEFCRLCIFFFKKQHFQKLKS